MSVGTSAVRERWLPWLLVLPALCFALPFSPLRRDPYPHLAGTGLAALLLAPAALFLLATRARLGGASVFLLVLLWAACVARPLAPVTDTLEARRALMGLALAPLAFAGGATLEEEGRARFALALVGLSCAWTAQASIQGLRADDWAGGLGDTGSLSQAALPGAASGAAWLVGARGIHRALGALALALFLVHVAGAPVLAGSHTLLAALLLAAWRGTGRGRGALLALALSALLAPFAGLAARAYLRGEATVGVEGAPARPSHSLSGLGVRTGVWKASLALVGDHPGLGAGPGQFQAAFPPYRDPREIERSRHGVCSELDTEVEHAHNDWLQAFVELGLAGGCLFVLGLGLAARAGLRALADPERLPLAMAALALLVNACVHAPLSANPASSPLAFALLGTLAPAAAPSRRAALAATLPALLALPFAPALITHGAILSDYVRSAERLTNHELPEHELVAEAARARAALLAAEAAQPDSAVLALLAARVAPPEERARTWERVLELRPHAVEAWEQSATDEARRGRYAEAQARYRRALELSPTHPRILRNYARLECTQGELELGLEALERLRGEGCLAPDWLASLGSELVLELGAPGRGALLLYDAPLEGLAPEELHARSRSGGPSAEAAECLAQLSWARGHAAAGSYALALRNYRQAAQRSHARRGAERGPAPLYALELAAAEARAGERDKARARARDVAVEQRTWNELPVWAREVLTELGLAAPEAG